jgi:hypothetical protein
MKTIKPILLLTFLICFFASVTVYANFFLFDAKELKITIKDIKDDISEIDLLISDDSLNFNEVYDQNNFDYENYKVSGCYASSIYESVDPYSKEDYIINENYDKTKYYVDISFSYRYTYKYGENQKAYSDTSYKPRDFNELRKEIMLFDDEKKYDFSNIKCERIVYYSAKRLTKIKNIEIDNIKNGIFTYSITDFSDIKNLEFPGYEYALGFKNTSGEYKVILCGHNKIYEDFFHDSSNDIIKKVVIDYNSSKVLFDYTDIINFDIIVYVISAIVITIIVELIVALIMKIKAMKTIIITNIITQFILHVVTILVLYFLGYMPYLLCIISEIVIVLVEFLIYKSRLKKYPKLKLFLYSFIANLFSFGLSVFIELLKANA